MLSHLFGLHPWDVEHLTPDEMAEYLATLAAYLAARKGS